jgi:hypothetical protein
MQLGMLTCGIASFRGNLEVDFRFMPDLEKVPKRTSVSGLIAACVNLILSQHLNDLRETHILSWDSFVKSQLCSIPFKIP